jgi:hypothetical protein
MAPELTMAMMESMSMFMSSSWSMLNFPDFKSLANSDGQLNFDQVAIRRIHLDFQHAEGGFLVGDYRERKRGIPERRRHRRKQNLGFFGV